MKRSDAMTITPLLDARAELTHCEGEAGPVVLSTRVRLARNLTNVSFPGWANQAQRSDVLSRVSDTLAHLPQMKDGTRLFMDEISDLEKLVLVERHLISRELSGGGRSAGVYIGKDQGCAIMINEEDHLRIQMMRSGFKLDELWSEINEVDTTLEDSVDYAFSPELGYLTACPTNLGTAMRASAMLHLPGLVLSSHMEKVIRTVNQLGMTVRGLFGEGTDATGSIFQISNQQTLGESEEAILKRLSNVLKAVIEQEKNAREKLLEDEKTKLLDKFGRARGILTNGHLLSSEEGMNHLSIIRLAVDMQMLPERYRAVVDRLFIEGQPGHIQYAAGSPIEPDERDVRRASLCREHFADLPPLSN